VYAVSPLRYPGAKWRLDQFVSAVISDNNIQQCHYAEPYAGGASLALSLLLRQVVSEIHLNDRDRSVWAFWKCVTEQPRELIAQIQSSPVTMDQWYAQREVQSHKESASLVDLAFSTFFLNRTNRSGILKAGVIGGKDQLGPWKISARFNKPDLIERIRRIAALRSRIHVTRLDALSFISRRDDSLPKRRSLMYLDPPYFHKGPELYMNSYEPRDHAAVAVLVTRKLRVPWIVSYDNVPQIKELYAGVRFMSYTLRYSASTTRKGKEMIFVRRGLKVRPCLLDDA
jgi:DNA adenine methylase